jgi:predicted DNA-binding ribbon-helix-helix protein
MSVALDADFQDKLKNLANSKGISVSSLIRDTLDKYLFAENNTVKIVFNVPKDLTADSEKLGIWLNQKCHAIVAHFKS